MTGIAIRFQKFVALCTDQKLFPHFSEARAAILAVKQVEYGGHDRPRRLIIAVNDSLSIPFGMQM
jgi:hypothetical protein